MVSTWPITSVSEDWCGTIAELLGAAASRGLGDGSAAAVTPPGIAAGAPPGAVPGTGLPAALDVMYMVNLPAWPGKRSG